jgi:hypothetical protein
MNEINKKHTTKSRNISWACFLVTWRCYVNVIGVVVVAVGGGDVVTWRRCVDVIGVIVVTVGGGDVVTR